MKETLDGCGAECGSARVFLMTDYVPLYKF